MRVVCPFAGQIHIETLRSFAAASRELLIAPEIFDVSPDDTCYGILLMELWRFGDPFVIVEQDIVFKASQLAGLIDCPEPYCAYPYEWETNLGPALGFTKFGAELLAAVAIPALARISWRQVDTHLMRTILGKQYGWQPHLHLPPVRHMNAAKSPLRPEFQHLSVTEHLAALGYRVSDDGATADYVDGDVFGHRWVSA